MSYQISTASGSRLTADAAESLPSDEEERLEADDGCSDWASVVAAPTKSLFDSHTFESAEEALEYDNTEHGYDLKAEVKRLDLDMYGFMRLVNLIRGKALSAKHAECLQADDRRLKDDALLVPVIPDDPLLQLDLDDSWSDDEPLAGRPVLPAAPGTEDQNTDQADSRLAALQAEITRLQADLAAAQGMLRLSIQDNSDSESEGGDPSAGPSRSAPSVAAGAPTSSSQRKGKQVLRDDDTHYFDSYADNEIHEVMLKDTNRTVSYARYILSNPHIFKDAVVMDVGCGTGILSMFAARAGAKHVYAIEASGIADKAIANIRSNGLGEKITVVRGKVEEISLPPSVDKVDVIISEWMGYMLLYESMLDSVLHARDRFLRPGAIMAPSAAKLVITAITGEQVWKERVAFWDNIYGFNMAPMSSPSFSEGLVEVVDADEVVTSSAAILHMDAYAATPKSLDFSSAFSISARSTSTTQVRAFLTYFDTFFSPISGADSQVTDEVDLHRWPDEAIDHPVDPTEASEAKPRGTQISFTTGPQGKPTHWKQVVFLLREPISLAPGATISGRFYCKKSTTNSRELDVEIHYGVTTGEKGGEASMTVQMYKVR